jgi:hypothetical protein
LDSIANLGSDKIILELLILSPVEVDSVCAKVVEPSGLTVNRIYEILWKKQSLNFAELVQMRFEEKLGSRVISLRLGLPRTTNINLRTFFMTLVRTA